MAARLARDVRTYYAGEIAKMRVDERDMRTLYFLMKGAPDTPYEGGEYVVRMTLPESYPFEPPSMAFLTPSGRFVAGAAICTTFSAHHPEAWSAGNTLSTLVISIASFMTDESDGLGSLRASAQERASLAASSASYNEAHGYAAMFHQ